MSPKKRKPSVAFSWHKSFAILAPWRKGKGDMVVESEVVLTKMKVFNTFHEKRLNAEDSVSTVSISVSEQNISPTLLEEVISVHSDAPEPTMAESKQDYLSAIFSDSQLPRLYKFESEDSGVEMPSGANSPSTPTGSEQSFVVHSRGSSCDLGTLNSSIPANSPLLLLEQSTGSLETEQTSCIYTQDDDLTLLQDSLEDEMDNILLGIAGDSEIPQDGTLGNVSESSKVSLVCADTAEARAEELAGEDMGSRSHDIEAYDGNTGAELQQQPLRKSTTSDSLDEYMEECCRLSEVNQAQSNPLGSGLGYLEHICQLIEKIGQLQEHNLKLQKEIYSLQKDSKMTKTKEDFFIQHCYCGAANLAFQELKRHSRSDYPSLTASSSTLSDLTTIPEGTRIPLHPAVRDVAGGRQLTAPLRRRGLNRRSYAEGEARYLSDSAEGLSATHRRVRHTDQLVTKLENYTWGRMKELVKKTRLRNQSRLGLSSGSLKRSCPQLYRPELGPLELCRRDRNSMIVLGHQKLDYHWSH